MKKISLINKKILISGASRGIGKACALALSEEGGILYLVGRSLSSLNKVKDEIEKKGGRAVCLSADLSEADGAEKLLASFKEQSLDLDVLINNAGIALSAPIEKTSQEEWDRIMRVNARSPYFLCQGALPLMESSQLKTIINIASVVATQGYPLQSAYTASKHALIGFSKSLARELQERGYRIHVLSPGGVATDMVTGVRPDINTDELIAPEELAEWIRFLLTVKGNGMVDHISIRRESKLPW
ncbi:MAG: hypothetical protein B6241_12930 [Spirochaetaceae bacterium 4572_59]|nr:MAG: hypothetical protein B6241_12930 [Spirochaetaceae bacterium 4572_59]